MIESGEHALWSFPEGALFNRVSTSPVLPRKKVGHQFLNIRNSHEIGTFAAQRVGTQSAST